LWGHFLSADENGRAAPPPAEASTATDSRAPRRDPTADVATDRHGIPRLDDGVDLHRFFEGRVEDVAAGDGLGDVFRRSLQHDARTLMKKKSGGVWEPRRLTIKEQLRRYPAPQAQLDLHGDTVLKARQRADSFIRTAMADGLLTLRLIVGKGLHSEGGAVLPDAIEDLLSSLKRESFVLAFRWEKGLKRKSGAVIVYLPPAF
jgi:DNA-nicking Smr family endonuclease